MRDGDKTKEQLIAELVDLRQQVVGLKGIQTRCKELDEAVEEERRTFFPVLQKAPYGIALIDRDGDFLYINPEFSKITGYSLVDIHAGRDWFLRAFIFPEGRKKFSKTWRRDIIHKGAERVLRFICKEGEIKEIEFKPTVLEDGRIIVMLSDITERKKTAEALEKERQRFKTLSENAPFGMVMVERDGTFRYINPKFKELFGYDLDDIPDGKTWFRKAYPEPGYRHKVIATWIKDLEALPSGEKGIWPVDTRVR